jgi:hypothetical protein
MKKVCLEDLAEEFSLASSSVETDAEKLQTADTTSLNALSSLKSCYENLADLEALGGFLSRNGTTLNRAGAVFANYAFESILIAAGTEPDTIVDAAAFEKDPQAAINTSSEIINRYRTELAKSLMRNAEVVMTTVAKRQESLTHAINLLAGRVQQLRVEILESPNTMPDTSEIKLWQGSEKLMRIGQGDYPHFEPSAKGIGMELQGFLSRHGATYAGMLDRYRRWVENSGQTVLTFADGGDQLVFDARSQLGMELLSPGDDGVNRKPVYTSGELPGMQAYNVTVLKERAQGNEAVACLGSIVGKFTDHNYAISGKQLTNLNGLDADREYRVRRLTREQALARLKDAEDTLDALKAWNETTTGWWTPALYNGMCVFIDRNGETSLQARFASDMGIALFSLLVEAGREVPDYVLSVLDNLVEYVRVSIARPQPE